MPLSNYEYLRLNHSLFMLTRAFEARINVDETYASMNLVVQDISILMVLGRRKRLNSRQLAALMGLSPAMTSVYVQKLVERGLLEKEQDCDDRRNWWLSLTELGEKVNQAILAATIQYTQDFMSGLDDGEQATLFDLLQKAYQNISKAYPDLPGKERLY